MLEICVNKGPIVVLCKNLPLCWGSESLTPVLSKDHRCHCPHIACEEMEAQKGEVNWLRSHS